MLCLQKVCHWKVVGNELFAVFCRTSTLHECRAGRGFQTNRKSINRLTVD